MTEFSWHWGGTSIGHATQAPYDDEFDWATIWREMFTYNFVEEGVLPGVGAELTISNPAGATVRVNSGRAIVHGKFYLNSAAVDNTVSGAAVYWIIGLRKSWAAKTVLVFARGSYASDAAAIASLVQTDGATWEIPLATVLTDGSGNVSVITDKRVFTRYASVKYVWRQGSDTEQWALAGATNIRGRLDKSQIGSINAVVAGVSSGTIAVTYPSAYVNMFGGGTPAPIVFLTSGYDKVAVQAVSITNTGFTINWYTVDGSNVTGTIIVYWLSVGGEYTS